MRILALAAVVIALPGTASAAIFPNTVSPFALTSTSYSQNFNTLASSGTTGSALPEGFQVYEGGNNANTTYRIGTGSDTDGTSWSFGAAGNSDRALGSIGSGNLTPIHYGAIFTNALGSTITELTFGYTGEQWRAGNSTNDGLTFQYSLDATSMNNGTWTTVTDLGFAPVVTSGNIALNGNTNSRALSATIAGLTLASGSNFAFRWVDVNSGGNDHGLAVDDLTIGAVTAVPEPGTWAMMIGGFGLIGGAMRRRRATPAIA